MNLLQRVSLGIFLILAFASVESLIEGKPYRKFYSSGAGVSLFVFIISSKSPGEIP